MSNNKQDVCDAKEIGRKIRKLRKDNGMTQEQLAEVLGCLPKKISRCETGKIHPYYSFIVAISRYFCVSTDYFSPSKGEHISNDSWKAN